MVTCDNERGTAHPVGGDSGPNPPTIRPGDNYANAGVGAPNGRVWTLVDPDAKLDAMVGQMADMRVTLATMSGTLNTIVTRLDAQDRDKQDHEARLRTLEQAPQPASCPARPCDDHEARLRVVERRLWAIPGAATVIAVIGLGVSIWKG